MGKTPRVDAGKVSVVLEKHGYEIVRQSGSHRIFRNQEGIRVTLPVHSGG
jgi:predicted RNA binding protein YcfA (HicA-like mRNA interferase family)